MNSKVFVQSLIDIFPDGAPLSEPSFHGQEWKYVKECIDTGWVSSAGAYVKKIEADLQSIFTDAYVIAMSTGTSALHMCCVAAGVSPGDEVLIPNLTFIATANAPCYQGAIPHIVDIDEQSLGVDPNKLREYLRAHCSVENEVCINEETRRPIRALIVMHAFGHPCQLDEILSVCNEFHITLIEDAAEALGSKYKSLPLGRHGKLSALSFNGNKIVTTGGGGAVVTMDEAIASRVRHLSTTAKCPPKVPGEFYHDEVGYNYRMPNINAALGCAQLEDLQKRIDSRRSWVQPYQEKLDRLGVGHLFTPLADCESNYWLQTFVLSSELKSEKNQILSDLNKHGIQARPVWNLMSSLPMFKGSPQMSLDCSEDLFDRIINLPSSMPL